ncbi:Glycosyltransferase involved in cell wall bisynthesis [Ectothiorhodospira mobilis]|uniref:Glycosyltransferase involved in cell wall bisynthesis n=1 Tax=Ectothiorhodospira mobilis TaxID=195064 RepID=A0A1I4S588_ECTMO|nr:glycosyltransferase [Ectothiorhodospira mobilis]SFM59430.1 Glycosyltransferase involved in cell wall bisynthesis [Ectothiorhodospira mobilis]
MAMAANTPRIACFFSTSGHSGVDRAAKQLIPALARRGYRVDLLKVRHHGPHLEAPHNRVTVVDLGSRHTYACLPALIRYLRRERPAVMLSDKDRVNRTALLASWIARWLFGVHTRLIFSSGTTISIDLATRSIIERWIQRNSMRHLYPFADQVIVTSAGVADDMAHYCGLAREKIRVVPSPVVTTSLFNKPLPCPDHPWLARSETPLILSAGELSKRKDFETLLRAFARVRAQRPCRLMILGQGKTRTDLLKLAAELGVSQDLELPGFVSEPYAFMAHADLFAFSSRWEGLGFVIIEALAVGTPVVATDCPSGPREILQNGRIGPLVPVGDDIAMAAAIMKTLDAPPPKELLREAARPYEVEVSTDAYLDAMQLPHNLDHNS